MESTDDIMRRFEERNKEPRPPRAPAPPPPPVVQRKYAPTDAQSRKILLGAVTVAQEVRMDYTENSPQDVALGVLVKFTKDMLGVK
jgi:hypothetical protein